MQVPSLTDALEAGLRSQKDEWGDHDLHVSDLGTTIPGEGCPRQLKLRLTGAEKRPPTVGELMMFENAHGIHARVTKLLQAGLPREWELEFKEQSITGLLPEGIRGTMDNLLRNRRENRVIVPDYKTVRGRAFNYLDKPKPANEIQVQGYIAAIDAEAGILLYLDREGSNASREFAVERNDQAVLGAINGLVQIRDSDELPPILGPKLVRNENKGPDSLKVEMPWPCKYCEFRDVSCPGALPPEKRERGIVAKINDKNELLVQDQEMAPLVEELLLAEGTQVA